MDDRIGEWKTKCHYLQQEIEQQKLQLEDCNKIIKVNKEALEAYFNFNNESQTNEIKTIRIVLKALQEENKILQSQNELLKQERNNALDKVILNKINQRKVLINEQISEAAERHEKQLIQELEQQVRDQTYNLQLKEQKIQELERKQTQENGLIVKYKEISNITDIGLKLHQHIEKQTQALGKQYTQIKDLIEQKEDLVRLNFSMSNEILKLRLQVPDPKNKSSGSNVFFGGKNDDPNYYIQKLARIQKQIMFDDSFEEQDNKSQNNIMQQQSIFSPLFSPLPKKVNNSAKQKVYYEVKKEDKGDELGQYEMIPKLDLTRAKQIQEYNIKKMAQQHGQKQNNQNMSIEQQNIEDRIQMYLLKELIECRNRYHAQCILNRQMDSMIDELKRERRELYGINDTLIRSNQLYEQKWRQFYHGYQMYKQFYISYKDKINQINQSATFSIPRQINQNNQINQNSQEVINSSVAIGNMSKQIDDNQISMYIYEMDKAINQSRRQQQDKLKDKSLLQVQDDSFRQVRHRQPSCEDIISNIPQETTREQYKQLWIQLAKDIYNLYQKQQDNQINKQQLQVPDEQNSDQDILLSHKKEIKRSISKTLDYSKKEVKKKKMLHDLLDLK